MHLREIAIIDFSWSERMCTNTMKMRKCSAYALFTSIVLVNLSKCEPKYIYVLVRNRNRRIKSYQNYLKFDSILELEIEYRHLSETKTNAI